MALETFDNGGSLDHLARVTEEQKERARVRVVLTLSEQGACSETIIEVFDMLGLWPIDHVRSGYGAI